MKNTFEETTAIRTAAALTLALGIACVGSAHAARQEVPAIQSARNDGANISFNVWLPAEYDMPEYASRRFPVIYYMHGIGGNKDRHNTDVLAAHATAASEGRITPAAIIVFMDSQGIATVPAALTDHDTFWANAFDGHRRVESDTLKIVEYVDNNYRTLSGPGNHDYRALLGFSMGAFGAASLATKYPQTFSTAVLIDGAMQTWTELTRTVGDGKPEVAQYMFNNDVNNYNLYSPWGNLAVNSAQVISQKVRFRTLGGAFGSPTGANNYAYDFNAALLSSSVDAQFYDTAEGHNLPRLLNPLGAADREASYRNWNFLQEAFDEPAKVGTRDDGSLLPNATNATAASAAITPSMLLGEDGVNRAYRGILSFNTGVLRNGAIASAKLKLTRAGGGSGNVAALGPLRVDIKSGAFGSSAALEAADYGDAPSRSNVGMYSAFPTAAGQAMEISLDAEALQYINRNGVTQFRLHFDQTSSPNTPETMAFATGDHATAAWRPTLTITYVTP